LLEQWFLLGRANGIIYSQVLINREINHMTVYGKGLPK
jgi:hypothetical protein